MELAQALIQIILGTEHGTGQNQILIFSLDPEANGQESHIETEERDIAIS